MTARKHTLEDARGRWREILGGLGIDRAFLRNKHGPCPMCGGVDRYRWDDKNNTGSYYCLGGETLVQTRIGRVQIRDLAGGVHRVMTTGGLWVDAPFRAYGKQRLFAVKLRRNKLRKVVRATAEHRWLVREKPGRSSERTTATLRRGHRLQSVLPQPPKCEPDRDAMRHGYVFGDGTVYSKTHSRAIVYKRSSDWPSMLDLFAGVGRRQEYADVVYVAELPRAWKTLPPLEAPDSYLLGFIMGLVAADGSVTKDGTIKLHQKDVAVLEWVRDAACRIGLVVYSISTQMRVGFGELSPISCLALSHVGIDPAWMPHAVKRRRLETGNKKHLRLKWVVEGVEDTGQMEEVFCAEVDGTHAFALADNLLTGNCSQCGPGSGMTLLMKFHGWTFKEACNKVDAFLGHNYTIDSRPIDRKPPPPIRDDRDKRRHAIEKVLREATAPDIVEEYLTGRGLTELPEPLRGHRGLNLWDQDRHLVGRFAAVVAPVLGPDGEIQSAHRIYLSEPRVKKLMPPVDTISGGAVRLFEPTESLGIAEGIETACGAYELFRIPTWSVISTGGIETFVPPAGITTLTVFADNDRNFAGQKAAFALASRLKADARFRHIELDVKVPPRPDTDWLDELNAVRPPPAGDGDEARP